MEESIANEELRAAWQAALDAVLPPKLKGLLLADAPTVRGDELSVPVMPFGLPMLEKVRADLEAALQGCGAHLRIAFVATDVALEDLPAPALRAPEAPERLREPTLCYGKSFRQKPVRLAEITEDGGRVVVEGRVFWLEKRTLRQGGSGLSFHISDDADSLTVKMFLKPGEELDVQCDQRLRIRGDLAFDRYRKETVLMGRDVLLLPGEEPVVSSLHRAELHLHTRMSAMDSVLSLESAFSEAARLGLDAVAVTDHGVVQSFPEAYELARKYGVRALYGLEAHLVDDEARVIQGRHPARLGTGRFVALDFETTSLSPRSGEIIEIGMRRFDADGLRDSFSRLVRPQRMPSAAVLELTGITSSELAEAAPMDDVLDDFLAFLGDDPIVAHNASFDGGFLETLLRARGISRDLCLIDTLMLARALLPGLKSYRLPDIAKALDINLGSHHRGGNDADVAALIATRLFERLREEGMETVHDLDALRTRVPITSQRPLHALILATDQTSLRELYRIVSRSHLEGFYRVPRVRRSWLANRSGLLVGAAGCEQSEVMREFLRGADAASLRAIMKFYDFIEVLPPKALLGLLRGSLFDEAQIESLLKDIDSMALELGLPVVASSDAHYLSAKERPLRDILLRGISGGDDGADRHLRSGDEMIAEMAFLGEERARAVVVDGPLAIAARCEDLRPVPEGLSAPDMPDAPREVRERAQGRARQLYGHPLPEFIEARLSRELKAIMEHGFAVVYSIAQKLAQKSLEDGYLVGSRGSVGSSLVAMLCGITEVNPLPAHYRCPSCLYVEFVEEAGSGFDLPQRDCPRCDAALAKDGQNIPFETFLGFHGEKVPDIDLNFSGEYQPQVHRYAEELFGKGQVFRAGTISTIAERTAYGMVKGYLRESGRVCRGAEIDRLAAGLVGVKRTTGQHPGGLMIVPKERDVHDFTPLQHPADDTNSQTLTTHFDYHAISERLLKLDLLGHDDPTVLRMLEDLTGVSALGVPLDDPEALSLFSSTKALKVTPEEIGCENGALGLPEFGTRFVRAMLDATRPRTFADLIRISGLSHGTDVWANNADALIRNGTATLADVIATRDDIMLTLMERGLPAPDAFRIMERVRKGRGLTDEDAQLMTEHGLPDWYLESCRKIGYMFPKAHAAAYVTMAVRIAYYKVHHPAAFYATYFSVRADEFDLALAQSDLRALTERLRAIEANPEATAKERGQITILELIREMRARHVNFLPLDLMRSQALRFGIEDGHLRPPFVSLSGFGRNGALHLAAARDESPFLSVEDVRTRGRVPRPVLASMRELGSLKALPETNQLTLFG